MTGHPVGERRAEDLDLERLGELLLRLPLASHELRHTSLRSSLVYIHALGDSPELDYVRDFLTLGTQEIIDRWFGGGEVATRTGATLMNDVVAELFQRARQAT